MGPHLQEGVLLPEVVHLHVQEQVNAHPKLDVVLSQMEEILLNLDLADLCQCHTNLNQIMAWDLDFI